MKEDKQNTLRNIYDHAIDRPNGYEWEYHGYTFRKSDATLTPEHSEVMALNEDGNKVESYTVEAFDSFRDFAGSVEELLEYDPDTLEDWLNR